MNNRRLLIAAEFHFVHPEDKDSTCGADGRSFVPSVYGHVITKFSGIGRFTYPWRFESSAINFMINGFTKVRERLVHVTVTRKLHLGHS